HYKYLTETLKGYDNVIAYRDNSPLHEACPVFYSTERFELTDKGSFWLSETPEEMSKDWGAACYRICSYVILKDKTNNKQLVVFNTHLDHISDEARINGINVVLDKIKQFGGLPSVIMGDFNADESSETYAAATELFLDAKYQTENTDSGATYQQWGKKLDDENIDYFMISKTGIKVNEYKVVDTTYDGVYPSDHFQIMIKINLT
ncbi:MAG: endonuclease/exonuclease/phosphatase family protein, partial [Eubacterium sp.]|nr:endonuclease/exonuclease/phosphatase family protein [Eubacterium sp.]